MGRLTQNQNIIMNLVNEELLLQLTDCDTLDEIRVISLRNKQLSQCLKMLAKCDNLAIVYLQNNQLNLKDLSYLHSFQNLKKIDLSDNQLESLPPAQIFAGLKKLQFLYLHNNNITQWQDLQSLTSLPEILHITLFSNPVCSIPGYRHFIVNSLSGLKALDNFVITDEERIEDASFGYRFRGLNEFMKLHIPDYTHERSAEQHLFNLEVDVYRLRRIFERNSPSILIQSLYRGYRSRNYVKIFFNERRHKIIKIQKVVRGWLHRRKFEKDLRDMLMYTGQQDLMMTSEEIRRRDYGLKILYHMRRFHKMKKLERQRQTAALKIQTFYKGRFVKNSSFVNALQLKQYPRIYFLKEQKPQFIKILRSQMAILEQENMTFEDAISCIREDRMYETIRVEEPDLFKYKPLPLLQFIMPTFGTKTIIKANKSLGIDKQKMPELTLKSFYFNEKKTSDFTSSKWETLKKRRCQFNSKELRETLEQRKKKSFLNQMVFFDKYNDFLVFEGPRVQLIVSILFAILDYNRTLDPYEDQQFLCFFEPLLQRQAAISKVQQAWRAYRFRRSLEKLPIHHIIERRAAFCIQSWWSNLKLRKRMSALSRIRKHVHMINSNEIYMEQTIYENINHVVSSAQTGFRFEEQAIMFDFNPTTFGIHMQIDEDPSKSKLRYKELSVPKWFNLKLFTPDFLVSPYVNNLQAFFHFNQGDCQIMPSTYVVNYQRCQMDIDRKLYFIKMTCSSVEEARKRALVMAYLTYDMTRHIFVQMSTGEMLEDPYIHQNIYHCHDLFSLEAEDQEVDVKALIPKQNAQQHQGMILTDKDARALQTSSKFKSVEMNEKFLNISVKDNQEGALLDREIANFNQNATQETQTSFPNPPGMQLSKPGTRDNTHNQYAQDTLDPSLEQPKLSKWEARRINEQHLATLKEQRFLHINKETQIYRAEKNAELQNAQFEALQKEDGARLEVAKQREIKRIIKQEQKNELDKNLSVFLNLNNEERILRQELVDKQMELQAKEKQLKIANVVHQNKIRHLKREEREKFVGSFAQAKNLIEKQMKMGLHIRDKKKSKENNRKKVLKVKQARQEEQMALPLKTKVYGGFEEQEDLTTQRSSAQKMSSYSDRRPGRRAMSYNSQSQSQFVSAYKQKQFAENGQFNSAIVERNQRSTFSNQHQRKASGRNSVKTSAQKGLLPPLHDTTFSEQYKTYKANGAYAKKGNQGQATGAIGGESLEMSHDLQKLIKKNVINKPYLKRTFQRPIFAEESYPIVGSHAQHGNSVFKMSGYQQLTPTNLKNSIIPINLVSGQKTQNGKSVNPVSPFVDGNPGHLPDASTLKMTPGSQQHYLAQHVTPQVNAFSNDDGSQFMSPIAPAGK